MLQFVNLFMFFFISFKWDKVQGVNVIGNDDRFTLKQWYDEVPCHPKHCNLTSIIAAKYQIEYGKH
jgi:hypothetical protein